MWRIEDNHESPVPQPERDPDRFRPVFVLAPARSNSSVVASMVGMHPDLYGFPELSLWRREKVRDLMADPSNGRGPSGQARTAGLARAIAEVFAGRQDVEAVGWARKWLEVRGEWEVACVFDELQARVSPLTAFEKSPENSNRQDHLDRLSAAYPQARFLHVTRHPVPTVRSMYKRWRPMNLWDLPDDLWHLYLLGGWLFQHGRIRSFTQSLPRERWMMVRSEDVLNAPEETLPRICRWLGVDAGEAAVEAMQHPEKSPFARLGPDTARGGNDLGFLESPRPRPTELPESLDLPAEWKVDPWTHVAVVEMAGTLGYHHKPAHPARPVRQPVRDPDRFRPVFVLAPARSNSSVVASMVGMHPDLYGFPELSLWRAEKVRDLISDPPNARGLSGQARTAGLARAIAAVFAGGQDIEAVQWARQWLEGRSEWDVACVFDELQARVSPLIALEKSPENSNRQDYLDRLSAAYPQARFLHVTRHPVPTVRSMYKAWKPMNLWDLPDDLWHLYLLGTWLFQHGRIRSFTQALPPERWMMVRSEDVLNAPAQTLPRICQWLGVDAGEAAVEAMQHAERSPFARLGPETALGGNDPGFLESPRPRPTELPESLDLPTEWQVDPWTHVAVVEMALVLGYHHRPGRSGCLNQVAQPASAGA